MAGTNTAIGLRSNVDEIWCSRIFRKQVLEVTKFLIEVHGMVMTEENTNEKDHFSRTGS